MDETKMVILSFPFHKCLSSLPSILSPPSPFTLSTSRILSFPFSCRQPTVKLYLHNPLSILFLILKYGSGVLDGQERINNGVDECDEAGAGDEVDRAGGYGRIVGM